MNNEAVSGEPRVMRTPRKVEIAITGKCNLRCKTCYYADEMIAQQDLPTNTWLSVMDELGEMGVMQVILSGGEPMTRRDLFEIIARLITNRMRFDGSCPEVHDSIRGEGSFKKAINGIFTLRNAGINVSVRVTINKLNVQDLPNIFYLLFEEFGLENVSTNEAFPRGAARCNLDDLDMTPEQRRQAERLCLEGAMKYPNLSAMAGPLAMATDLKEIVSLDGQSSLKKPGGGRLTACGGVFNSLAILHNGAIVPCIQIPHLVMGFVGESPIKDLWQNSTKIRDLRSRHRIQLDQLESCKDCDYQSFCTGGCPAIAYAVTGEINGRDPRSCYRALLGEDHEYVF